MVFPLSYLPNLFMQLIGIIFIIEVLEVPEYLGGLLSTIIALPLTYLVMTYILNENEEGEIKTDGQT